MCFNHISVLCPAASSPHLAGGVCAKPYCVQSACQRTACNVCQSQVKSLKKVICRVLCTNLQLPVTHLTNETQADRYAMARHFRPPGRLMFLRPVKTSCQEPAARRAFEAVWIDAEVGIHQCTLALRCRGRVPGNLLNA